MSKVIIKKLKVEGFGSLKELKYGFDRQGLSTITGENGVGKTSIINALTWCLYKQLVKPGASITPWASVMDEDFIGTRVRLELERDGIKYEIIRCHEYQGKVLGVKGKNRLVLMVNGEQSPLRDKDDIQKEINSIMGATFTLFKSSAMFGQKMKRLIEEDGPNKKKVFEEAFEISFISKAKEKIEKKLPQLIKEVEVSTNAVNQYKSELTTLKDNLNTAEKLGEKEKLDWKDKLKDLRSKIEEAKEKLSNIPNIESLKEQRNELKSKVSEGLGKLSKAANDEFKLNMSLNTLKGDVERMGLNLSEWRNKYKNTPKKCYECGQKLSSNYVKEYKEKIKSELTKAKKAYIKYSQVVKEEQGKYDSIVNELSSLKAKVDKINLNIAEKIKKLESSIDAYMTERATLKEKIAYAKEQLAQTKANPPSYTKETITSLKTSIEDITAKLLFAEDTLERAIKELDLHKWLVKEPLSNSGLKAYIFDAMLGNLNRGLKKYERAIGFRVNVGIRLDNYNKDFVIKIYKNKEEIPYADLSGGQQQLANVALAFALDDVTNQTNIVIMDEVFESISRKNVEIVSDMIQQKARYKSTHIITHQASFNPSNSYQRILELNEKGQTVVTSKLAQN